MYSLFFGKLKTPSLIFLMVFAAAALPACLASSQAQAQNRRPTTKGSPGTRPGADKSKSPSLKETLSFLEAKLNTVANAVEKEPFGTATKYFSRKIDQVKFEGCAMTYHYTVKSEVEGKLMMGMVQSITLTLGDIDPAKVALVTNEPPIQVRLSPLPGKKIKSDARMLILGQSRETTAGDLESATFPFEDKEMADRVAKAFSHAISLCKTKKEPF